ncbi:MAG: anti-sigma factor family protein [Gemmatimonadota bacterium]|nr:zf-HC2 domain-containing protein [Gemmatimonadota bacterium]
MTVHVHAECLAVVRAMYDYLDEELTAERLAEMQGHLAACAGCREHVEMARCFLARLSALPVDEQDCAALAERVRAALRREAGLPPA